MEKQPQSELLNAKYARNLTVNHSITIEKICGIIQNSAESGNSSTCFMGVLFSPDLIHQILILGYSISQYVDPFGNDVTKINW